MVSKDRDKKPKSNSPLDNPWQDITSDLDDLDDLGMGDCDCGAGFIDFGMDF